MGVSAGGIGGEGAYRQRNTVGRVATNLENMENLEDSGNLKNCQNVRENSGKFEFL